MTKTFTSVGVTILDIVGYPIHQIPTNEQTELVEKIQICAAGTAAAPAVVAARLGLDSTLAAALGQDDMGHFLQYKLQQEGVNIHCLQLRDDQPTAATILPINKDGGRPNWHMPGAFMMLEPTEQLREAIINADHIHWGGVGLLFNLDGEIGAEILAEAKQRGATITADLIAPMPHTLDSLKAIAPYLDFFMPSIDEALPLAEADNVTAAADVFMELGARGVLIKCGGDGAYLATQNGLREQIPVIHDVPVVDTSGCGDAFCGGFNVGLANGFDPVKAARFASATAALVATGVGSNAGIKDFASTLELMESGSWKALSQENA